VTDPELRTLLLRDPTVQQTFDRARRADMALLGIAILANPATWCAWAGTRRWRSRGPACTARLPMFPTTILDINGNLSAPELPHRIIGL
jgi:DNA-binding transcriptional regulator LsrR (DeoR family)